MKTYFKVAVIVATGVLITGGTSLPAQRPLSSSIKLDVWTECQEQFSHRCMVVHGSHVFCADQTNMQVCLAADGRDQVALIQWRASN